MINYSIVNRTVNTNLLEINQAKARVAKAKEAGVTPEPADVEMANTPMQYRAYAIAQYADVMTIEKFAKHIATHGCVYSRADISAILYMAVDCMRELLLEGKKIRLGDLGDFSVNIQSKGADTPDKFNAAAHITAVNVNWDCGQEFKNLIADAEFNLVASRSAQAAVIKAIKAGSTTVDLTGGNDNDDPSTGSGQAPDNNPDGGGTTPSNPSNPSNPSGSGTNPTRQYTISVTSADTAQGTVSGGGTYSEGSRVNISANPKSGYQFDKWSDGNTSSVRTINVSKNESFVAQFKVAESGDDNTEPGGEGGNTGGSDRPNYI